MPTKTFILRGPAGPVPEMRTFVVEFSSTRAGYEARVSERLSDDELVPMALDMPPRQDIDAGTFYRDRARYRTFLLDCIKEEIARGALRRPRAEDAKPVMQATIAANLIGWAHGHPDACDDDLAGWDPMAKAAGDKS